MEADKTISEKVKEEPSVLQQAEAIAKRIEDANNKAAELLAKQEQQLSRIMLSGRSQANLETPQKSENDKKKEGAMNFFKGTEIEKIIQKHG